MRKPKEINARLDAVEKEVKEIRKMADAEEVELSIACRIDNEVGVEFHKDEDGDLHIVAEDEGLESTIEIFMRQPDVDRLIAWLQRHRK